MGNKLQLRTWTFNNPYPYNRGANDVAQRAWDYTGPYKVVRRNWHMKDGKRLYITSVVVTDGSKVPVRRDH